MEVIYECNSEQYLQAQHQANTPNIHEPMDVQLFSIFGETVSRDDKEVQSSKMVDEAMNHELSNAGFNLYNSNLICVQMINALQTQMDVLEHAIFKATPQSLFDYGIGFNFQGESLFQEQECESLVKHQPNFEASDDLFNKYKKIGVRLEDKSNTSCEDKMARIVDEKWEIVSIQNKSSYLLLRKRIEQLKKVISESLTHKKGKEHTCLLCGLTFTNGRQLGGHMSRKHPGNSIDYNKKRQVHFTKTVERERRRYFKQIKQEPLKKMKIIAKSKLPSVKAEQL